MEKKRVIALPPWLESLETRAVLSALTDASRTVRFVGGCVRDTLLGRPVTDLDIATTLKPSDVIYQLQKANIKTVPLGLEHGSVLAVTGSYHYEITTLRHDIETDGRHAKVSFTDDWKEDAKRRDFTFNALYLSIKGELYDPWGGEEDLQKGRVRFIGDASERIQEDYLRILRYFRFYASYGQGETDAEALESCKKYAAKIKNLSAERIHTEILKLLKAPLPLYALQKMEETGVWFHAMQGAPSPDIKQLEKLIKLEQEFHIMPKALRRLAAILKDNGNALHILSKELKFSHKEKKELESLVKLAGHLCMDSRELLYEHGLETTRDVLLLQVTQGYNRTLLEQLPLSWEKPIFPLSGEDLKTLGIAPGPLFGKILKHVETWWVKQHFAPDATQCLEEARKYSQSFTSHS